MSGKPSLTKPPAVGASQEKGINSKMGKNYILFSLIDLATALLVKTPSHQKLVMFFSVQLCLLDLKFLTV